MADDGEPRIDRQGLGRDALSRREVLHPGANPATGMQVPVVGRTLVWSKNSCGFVLVVFQKPAEPFSTMNRACTSFVCL